MTSGEGEVERRINAVSQSRGPILDLTGCGLTALPDALSRLADLTTLSLGSNWLADLPEWIGELASLTTLDVGDNGLTQLPDALGDLTSLTRLDVSDNKLTQLPDALGDLTGLTRLDLSSNGLTELPEWIGNLTNLTELDLGYNKLSSLPDALGDLTSLTELHLSHNKLSSLPEWIGNLTNLNELGIGNSSLTELPEWIDNLTNLTKLYLSNSSLTELPEWIGNLTHLTGLDLSDNGLTELPEWIGNLTNLTELDLENNGISELPEWIGNLIHLIELNLHNNLLTRPPNALGNLTELTTLYLGSNNLTELPDALGNLTSLTELYIFGGELNGLPETLGNLNDLTTLQLDNNGLTELPECVGNLAHLTDLHLSSNGLTELPEWIGNLTNLTGLSLMDNKLTELPEALGDLTNLTNLHLGSNELAVLPECVGNLARLTDLHLSSNRLTELPEWIGNLTNLTTLGLSDNKLTELPEALGDLTNLTNLHLGSNELTELPEWIGNLTHLTNLHLGSNELTELPEWIGNLTNLTTLGLSSNKLTELPEWIGNLTHLTNLHLGSNGLTELPEWIGNLTNLTELGLSNNKLTELPGELGNLTNLAMLGLTENPWVTPPPEVCAGGTSGVLAFLRSLQEGAGRQWRSKMLVVGEAAVGKTSVTKALCQLPYNPNEPQTHGVHIDPLYLEHPHHPGVRMRLTVWDFGGQLEYRATQRFYLTDRSVFLLVWNSRRGWRAGGQVEAWLQAITTAAPKSPIVIVATHCKKSVTDLDETDLRRRYPRITEIHRVDCEDGTGIDDLRAALARQAAELPLMGARWPTTWTRATTDLCSAEGRSITLGQARKALDRAGLDGPEAHDALLRALHDRGQIMHVPHDPRLRDHVILRPEWVDEMITRILDSQQIADRGGLLSREHRAELWRDLDDPALVEMLTSLMERFDLAYRIDATNHDDVALVVERLPAGTPEKLPPEWTTALDKPAARELRVTYKLGSRQAGIPSWFIAREHRFTTGIAWARGVLLRHHGAASPAVALLTDDDQAQPTLRLTVRSTEPHSFYSILNEAFTGILADRYPGLPMSRMIPCPCAASGEPECTTEFAYDDALRMLERERSLYCNTSGEMIDPRVLLLGLRTLPVEQALAQMSNKLATIDARTHRIEGQSLLMLDGIRDLMRYRDEQGTHCPGIFTVTKTGRTSYELQLYCEYPDYPHPLPDGAGIYQLIRFPVWLRRYAPYLRTILTALKYAMPLAKPVLTGIADQVLPAVDTARLELATALLDDLSTLVDSDSTEHDPWATSASPQTTADFTALRKALLNLDPDFGGLRERELPENRGIVYLCHHHRQALRYPAHPKPEASESSL